MNLSARLQSSGKSQKNSAGFGEIWRLIKIARPRSQVAGIGVCFPVDLVVHHYVDTFFDRKDFAILQLRIRLKATNCSGWTSSSFIWLSGWC